MEANFIIFTATSEVNPVRLVGTIHPHMFTNMVVAACALINQYLNPKSPDYRQPDQYVGESFDSAVQLMRPDLPLNWYNIGGADLSNAVMGQRDILEQYVAIVNKDIVFIGDSYQVRAMVYKALVVAHEFRVACLEKSIAASGPRFGSHTLWHSEDNMKPIMHWPQKFEFDPLPITPLPCMRDDWQERIAAWDASQGR